MWPAFLSDLPELDANTDISITVESTESTTQSWRNFNYEHWIEKNKQFDHEKWDKMTEFEEGFNPPNWPEEIIKKVKKAEEACGGQPPWKPIVHYNQDGDLLSIWFSEETNCYGQWLCPGIVIMLSEGKNEIVGIKIEGLLHGGFVTNL